MIVIMLMIAVVMVPVAFTVPLAFHSVPPNVVGAPAVLAFLVQFVATALGLGTLLTVLVDGFIQLGLGPFDAVPTLLPVVIRAGARCCGR